MRCPVVADEGTEQARQCVREAHPDDPDQHDFAGQAVAAMAVDGGQSWKEWIRQVREVREALLGLPVPRASGGPYRPDAQAMTTKHATAMLRVAGAVGLEGIQNEEGVIVFQERSSGVR